MPAGTSIPHIDGFEIAPETDTTYLVSRPGEAPRLRLHVLFIGYRTSNQEPGRRNVTGGVPEVRLDEVRRRLDMVAAEAFDFRGVGWPEGRLEFEVAGDGDAWPYPVLRADMSESLGCAYEVVPVTFGIQVVSEGDDPSAATDDDVDMIMDLRDLEDELAAYAARGLV